MTSDELKTKVNEAMGTASLCWDARPTGVFDAEQALKVADGLMEHVFAYTTAATGAHSAPYLQQIADLADFFLKEWPDEIGEGGAVDNAIRVLRGVKAREGLTMAERRQIVHRRFRARLGCADGPTVQDEPADHSAACNMLVEQLNPNE